MSVTSSPARSIGGQHFRQRGNVAAGEDVLRDPGVGDRGSFRPADRMQQHHAVVGEQVMALAEESVVVADADMLEHADRDDPVEFLRHVAIVLQPERDAVREAFFGCAPRCECVLLLGQGDAGDVGVQQLGEIEREPAPAAADVEDAHVAARGPAWRRDAASWRVGRRRAIGPAARSRRSCIAGRSRETASRAGRRDRSDGRHCGARGSVD